MKRMRASGKADCSARSDLLDHTPEKTAWVAFCARSRGCRGIDTGPPESESALDE